MFPAIGFAFDLLGAITLAVGLFRAPTALYPGSDRSPHEAASDRTLGPFGALFLVIGFTTQQLPGFGVTWNGSAARRWLRAAWPWRLAS
jgi:hypothetical protein